MEIIFSLEFKKEFKRIRDRSVRLKIIKHLKKLAQLPESGKPLKYEGQLLSTLTGMILAMGAAPLIGVAPKAYPRIVLVT